MKVLITGCGGMVGSHLMEYLCSKGEMVTGTYYKPTVAIQELSVDIPIWECDVRYFSPIYSIIRKILPDKIFHLAAQSYPTVSIARPEETFNINVVGTINIFEAIKQIKSDKPQYNPTVVVACSSAEYGESLLASTDPITENALLLPLHPYGVSKVAQDLLTFQYFKSDKLNGIRARIFNTTGPRKVNDVCSDLTKRAIEIEKNRAQGGNKYLSVGNLETRRAIMDVRDLVVALDLLANKGKPGEVYNISGSSVYQISDIIDMIKAYTSVTFEIKVESSLLRPTDEPIIVGNSEKLKLATGWVQKWKLEDTIRDMLEYWRKIL